MRVRHLLVILGCCLVPSVAFGQTVNVTFGGVDGRVTDSTGSVLPGVTVTATNLDTGLKRTVVTEGDGSYVINLLPPGRYQVDAELSGLGQARVPLIEVLLGNATRADLAIRLQLSETVEVVATTPVVDTSRTGTAVSVTDQQIQNLPLLGRDFRSLAALTPGIVDAFGSRIAANGARGIATDYNIDGASSNNDFFGENTGGTRAPFTFSQAAIREFHASMPPWNPTRELHIDEIRGSGNLAYVVGHATILPEGSSTPLVVSRTLDIRVRQADGTWMFARDMVTPIAPPPKSPPP